MPGHFYTAPPSFIGGRQPYAPKQGLPQSGPLTEPTRKTNPYVALAQWTPAAPAFIGGRQPYAPRQGLPQSVGGLLVPPSRRPMATVHSWWTHDPITTVWITSIAPFLADPGPPQPKTLQAFFSIREQWNPPHFQHPKRVLVAALLATAPAADAPPPKNLAAYYALRRQWEPAPHALPEAASFAPLIPAAVTADVPPLTSWQEFYAVRAAWNPVPYELPERAVFAPLLALDVPQPSTANARAMLAIRESWSVTLPMSQQRTIVMTESGPDVFVPGTIRKQRGLEVRGKTRGLKRP